MIVIKRRLHQEAIATLDDGRDLIVRVCHIGHGWVRLGFVGPHRIVREEIYDKPRKALSHLAGPPIVVGSYHIQRCSLCGEILNQFDSAEQTITPLSPGLAVGRLYEVDSGLRLLDSQEKYRFETDSALPSNCCIFRGTK